MEPIKTYDELVSRIKVVSHRRDLEQEMVITEFKLLKENLKPMNLIRGFLQDFKESRDVKQDVLSGGLGLITGFLTNKFLLGSVRGPLKTAIATLIPGLFTTLGVKAPDAIKEKGLPWLSRFLQNLKLRTAQERQHEAADSTL
jgi:hypothetical protein